VLLNLTFVVLDETFEHCLDQRFLGGEMIQDAPLAQFGFPGHGV
jgi:hypothetical protein